MPRKRSKAADLPIVAPDAAGIDIGATQIFVAVPAHRDSESIRCFQTFTADLHRLADWLQKCGIRTVAMESTGVYWIPLFQILEKRKIDVRLVNAHHVKNVPGRKTDVADCQWIQHLHACGLLRGSFRPDDEINPLRNRDLDGHWCVFGVGTTCTSTPPPPTPRLGGGPSSSRTRGGAAGAAFGTGGLLVHDANVRADYVTRVGGALTDRGQWSATRAGVKVEARAATSGIGTGVTAMADSASSGVGGFTATNTRQSVNALAENSGTLGAGLMAVGVTIAVVDVATAPEGQRGRTAAGEAGSLTVGAGGAWAGAELGAAIGSFFPGPGTVIGGVVGGLVGGFFGGQAGHDIGTQTYDDIVH